MKNRTAVFDLQKDIIRDYTSFISSFLNIADSEIQDVVTKEVKEGRFWPEPLIQFNPSFQIEGPVSQFCGKGKLLHPALSNTLGIINLFKHQVEALELGTNDKDFVVTSGTGSGKSLTYLATIFNYLFSKESLKGIKAVIVYPMNALINSQRDSLIEYKDNFEKVTGTPFPISFARYTGQEKQDERDAVQANLPDILLTNYMMLELLLTRSQEAVVRESIFQNIRFLVFDELHTYRGRQGADVAMLIRKIKAQTENHVVCIGTSATMVSGGSIEQQRQKVATVASRIFGCTFKSEQIITEKLVQCFNSLTTPKYTKSDLIESLRLDMNKNGSEESLKTFPLAIWLENSVALETRDGILIRRPPMTISEIVAKLSIESGYTESQCREKLFQLLEWISILNTSKENQKYSFLPYRLHQFISQTGTVFVSLGKHEGKRYVTLDPAICKQQGDSCIPLYPVVFSRYSGYPFACVTKDERSQKFLARDFGEILEENEENLTEGYLILEQKAWDPDEDSDSLPDSWGRFDKSGTFKINKDFAARLPQKIYFDNSGNFSDTDKYENWGWFMPSPLLFDPTAGIFFYAHTSEGTKLSRLGSEGRSTSTTVLSFSILKQLIQYGYPYKDQKLLSFTDNRQDAALQAGHFNDYMRVIRIRSAINKAVQHHEELDYSRLDQALFDGLNLRQEEYAKNPSDFPSTQRENEKALKYYLTYRALYDLRHAWKVVLPNLEQCALLKIGYKNILENCSLESAWQKIPILSKWRPEERADIVFQILDYFRKGYALYSSEYLTPNAINEKGKIIRERLKERWSFDEKERIEEPNFFRLDKLPDVKTRLFTQSIGPRTPLGKFIKTKIRPDPQHKLSDKEYIDFLNQLLGLMVKADWLHCQDYPERNPKAIKLFQLKVDQIVWQKGDLKNIHPDRIRIRAYKDIVLRPNLFFQGVYQTDFGTFEKTFYGMEHTGQLTSDDRQDREDKFRSGDCSVLFCSPTMELGVDIKTLNVVHMRNVPPNPSNYAQRSGRAGRSGQGALVFVNCSTYSPHDRHYFRNKIQMVSGTVAPPKIDLYNQELLESHLYSLYLAKVGLGNLHNSIIDVIDETKLDLPLKNDVIESLKISPQQRMEIKRTFFKIIEAIRSQCVEQSPQWFNDEWFDITLSNAPKRFNDAFSRWRTLYKSAMSQLDTAQAIIRDGRFKEGSPEKRDAYRNVKLADRQRNLLRNDLGEKKNTTISEFYPYRYLAAEGFLPGYNFTRLPIRSFIPIGESGEYISRPRFMALKEFGPRNRIYHNGYRYRVDQILIQEAEKSLTKAKVSVNCGYILMENDGTYGYEVCPFSNVSLSEGSNREIYTDLLEMSETKCQDESRITCEEEERLKQGYNIVTHFSVADFNRIKTAILKNDSDEFLKIRYIPAAKLIQINKRWKISGEDGYLLGLTSGRWKTPPKPLKKGQVPEPPTEEQRNVKLYTWDTADALYLIPVKALALERNGVITLQFALKRAIENVFQVESNEIAAVLMGDPKEPNIMLYESAQGSLGILSQFMDDVRIFRQVIEEAKRLCRFDEPEYKEPASYDDLLSYYNQMFHSDIDRFTIKDALNKLLTCNLEIIGTGSMGSYEEHYQSLKRQCDPNSSTEHQFLDFLHERGLRLPDAAQKRVDYLYTQPDFFYEPNIWVFCDGSPHDQPSIKQEDQEIRQSIKGHGDQVIVYYYKDDLNDLVTRRADIFKKVR
jgi:superfamily II DNA/RNA helicase